MTKRKLYVHSVLCIILVAVFVIANVALKMLFGVATIYFNDMGIVLDSPESEAAQSESEAFTEVIVQEGIVLLRN